MTCYILGFCKAELLLQLKSKVSQQKWRKQPVSPPVGMGSGLSFLNNLGQLVVALGGESDGQAVFVSLFSVSNCAGRLLLG